MHASSGDIVGDEAVLAVLGWSDGRFRIMRDTDQQPRTITQGITELLASGDLHAASATDSQTSEQLEGSPDERLLHELLSLLTRLEKDCGRLTDGKVEAGSVQALLVLTTIVNTLVAFVTSRCSDADVLPSRVLPRLAETLPYTQLLGEESERISIATGASMLKNWNTNPEERKQLFQDLCRALLDVLLMYCNTVNTFFRSSLEREEWRATFDVFVEGLWTAVKQIEA